MDSRESKAGGPGTYTLLAGAQTTTGSMEPDESKTISEFELFKRRQPEGTSERISPAKVIREQKVNFKFIRNFNLK